MAQVIGAIESVLSPLVVDGAPLQSYPQDSPVPQTRVLPLALIDLPQQRIRRPLSPDQAADIAASLSPDLLLSPILVQPSRDRYLLVAGERHLQAARALGRETIEALVQTEDEAKAYAAEMVENLRHEALPPEDEAEAFMALMETQGWGVRELAERVGRSPAHISKRTRIFADALLRHAVTQQGMMISVAEELVALPDAERTALVQQALAEGWDSRTARQALRRPGDAPPRVHRRPSAERRERGGSPSERELVALRVLRHAEEATATLGRPQAFDRQARAFLELLLQVRVEDLTEKDKRLLTRIWQTIGLLARAAPRGGPVIPPLPTR